MNDDGDNDTEKELNHRLDSSNLKALSRVIGSEASTYHWQITCGSRVKCLDTGKRVSKANFEGQASELLGWSRETRAGLYKADRRRRKAHGPVTDFYCFEFTFPDQFKTSSLTKPFPSFIMPAMGLHISPANAHKT